MRAVQFIKCGCGCHETFEAGRSNQKYLDSTHKERARKLRSVVKRLSKDQAAFLDGRGTRQAPISAVVTTLPGRNLSQTSRWPQFLTASELACLLRVTRWVLWDWRRHRIGPPFVKLARGTLRYPRAAFENYIARHIKEGN